MNKSTNPNKFDQIFYLRMQCHDKFSKPLVHKWTKKS